MFEVLLQHNRYIIPNMKCFSYESGKNFPNYRTYLEIQYHCSQPQNDCYILLVMLHASLLCIARKISPAEESKDWNSLIMYKLLCQLLLLIDKWWLIITVHSIIAAISWLLPLILQLFHIGLLGAAFFYHSYAVLS